MNLARSFLGLIVLLVFQSCATTQLQTAPDPQMNVNVRDDLMFVTLEINQKKGIFLVDTGAGISLIDLNQATKYNFEYYENANRGELKGIGGSGSFNPTTGIEVAYSGNDYTGFRFYGSDLDRLNEYFGKTGFKILGVLGSDFFNKTGALIDFQNKTISFNKPQKIVRASH